jgi:Holliday junction resolvasome RuvABC endonuclease subunit
MRILGIDPGIASTGWSVVDFNDNGSATPLIWGNNYF